MPASSGPGNDEPLVIARWLSWGSFLPVVGWAYGVSLLWWSDRLTTRAKVMGSLLFPGGWFGAFVVVWLIGRQSAGYCWVATGGAAGSGETVSESGCVGPTLPAALGIGLTLACLVAAAIGPAYVRRRGLQREA